MNLSRLDPESLATTVLYCTGLYRGVGEREYAVVWAKGQQVPEMAVAQDAWWEVIEK